jgi:hypothetical protein
MSLPYPLLTDDLADEIVELPAEERGDWLILGPHPESSVHWQVNSLDEGFFFDFEDLLGPYRALAPAKLSAFEALVQDLNYRVAIEESATDLVGLERALEVSPGVEISSPLPGTTHGFLGYQRREFNRLKDKPFGLAVWSTGTGKTVLASALCAYHRPEYDAALVVVKRHNRVNTQRKIKRLVGLDTDNIRGPRDQRLRAYARFANAIDDGEKPVLVLNYEKFRDDFVDQETYKTDTGKEKIRYNLSEVGEVLFPGRKLLIVWDEMPMKLKNRDTHLYKSVCRCLYETTPPQVVADKLIPEQVWQYMLSATPVETDPEDVFNCVRLMDGAQTLGTVSQFRKQYVKTYNFFNPYVPEKWHNLEHMNLKLAPYTSIVDKRTPEIRDMFPDMIEEPRYVEWDEVNDRIYKSVTSWIKDRIEDPEQENPNPLSVIAVLQMLCNLPSMINESAEHREEFEEAMQVYLEDGEDQKEPVVKGAELALEIYNEFGPLKDDDHGKLEELRYIIEEEHPGEKGIVYTMYGPMLLPKLSAKLTEWGISHVVFEGSDNERQAALDAFKSDPDIRIFLSSDAGSDSIDLEEASFSVDFDLPWAHARLTQRRNRASRVTSTHEKIVCYALLMENSIEDRKVKRLAEKLGYHEGVFHGLGEDQIRSARFDKGDLMYVLTGADLD